MRWNELVRGKWYQSPTISNNSVPQPRYLNVKGDMEDIKGKIQCEAKNMHWTYARDEWTEIPNPKEAKAEVWLNGDKFVRATPNVKINRIKTFGSIAVGYTFIYKNKVYRKVASTNSVYGLSCDFILSEFGDSIEVE